MNYAAADGWVRLGLGLDEGGHEIVKPARRRAGGVGDVVVEERSMTRMADSFMKPGEVSCVVVEGES